LVGTVNFAIAKLESGDWQAAQHSIDEALAFLAEDDRVLLMWQAIFDTLRGDLARATIRLGELGDFDDAETQDHATVALCRALIAYSAGDLEQSLSSAREAFDYAESLGMTSDTSRWSWPAAARAAYLLDDAASTDELLKLLADRPANSLPRIVRAERSLVLARRHFDVAPADPDSDAAMASAIDGLRDVGSPWHLMLGLGDRAAQLIRAGRGSEASAELDEAESVARAVGANGVLAQLSELRARS
jgi:uncharacterized protein HemY